MSRMQQARDTFLRINKIMEDIENGGYYELTHDDWKRLKKTISIGLHAQSGFILHDGSMYCPDYYEIKERQTDDN